MKNNKNILLKILVLLLGVSLAACSTAKAGNPTEAETAVSMENTSIVSVTGVIVPETFASLSTAAPGLVAEVLVSEGQEVAEGQELITLSERTQHEAALTAGKLELATAQQAYDDFNRNARLGHTADWQAYIDAQTARVAAEKDWQALNDDKIDEKIQDLEVEVQGRKDDLDTAQEEFDKYKDLDKDNATRKRAEDDLDNKQKAYDKALWDLQEATIERDTARASLDRALATETEAKRQYELTLSGSDTEQLALLEARLTNAKTQVEAAQQNLDNLSLLAPFGGTVTNLNVKPGEWAPTGQPVVILADLNSLRIETTDLNEVDVAKIHLEDTVSITFDALPEATITGVVMRIAPKASAGSGVNYTVVVNMDEIPEQLRWGMTAYLDIQLEK